jgi:hypothetical protein
MIPTPLDPVIVPSCMAPACQRVYLSAVVGLLVAYMLWAPFVVAGRPVPAWAKIAASTAAMVGTLMSLVVMLWACPPCGGA